VSILRGGPRHAAPVAGPAPGRRRLSLGLELLFTALVVVVASFVLKTFVIQSFYVPSESMEDTLAVSDRIIVSKLAPGPWKVHRGDIVVFHDRDGWSAQSLPLPEDKGLASWLHGVAQALGFAPEDPEGYIVKRVIGLPGDIVACGGEGDPVTVNGHPLDEPYLKPGVAPSALGFRVEVPEGGLWVMGDNRSNSSDSRFHQDQALSGAIAVDSVVGVAKIRVWPLSRMGLLRNPGAVFRDVS
jgi:signal peptidase I